jgi:hypothetical protein
MMQSRIETFKYHTRKHTGSTHAGHVPSIAWCTKQALSSNTSIATSPAPDYAIRAGRSSDPDPMQLRLLICIAN